MTSIARLPTDTPSVLREHVARHRSTERSGSIWIYVGSPVIDGVDGLLTPDSPRFLNGWTNSLGDDPPVSFTIIDGWVHIRGGFVGGADGTVVFLLPAGYRPSHKQRYVGGTSADDHYCTYHALPSGEVVFGTVV